MEVTKCRQWISDTSAAPIPGTRQPLVSSVPSPNILLPSKLLSPKRAASRLGLSNFPLGLRLNRNSGGFRRRRLLRFVARQPSPGPRGLPWTEGSARAPPTQSAPPSVLSPEPAPSCSGLSIQRRWR
jgi:hypothetical protein